MVDLYKHWDKAWSLDQNQLITILKLYTEEEELLRAKVESKRIRSNRKAQNSTLQKYPNKMKIKMSLKQRDREK